MARQVTETTIRKFMNDENFRLSNTEIITDSESTKLYLFGNLIARKDKATGKIEVTMAGYGTATTRERLNGLPNVRINQINGAQYLNGKVIDTYKWYAIN